MTSKLLCRGLAALNAAVTVLLVCGTAHAITDTNFTYSKTKKAFYSIHPSAFYPDRSTDSYSAGWGLGVSGNTNTCFNGSVTLPDGVTVTGLAGWFKSTSGKIAFWMARVELSTIGNYNYLATTTVTDTSATLKPVALAVSANNVIDNQHYSYMIGFCMGDPADIFHGGRIAFTYNNAGY